MVAGVLMFLVAGRHLGGVDSTILSDLSLALQHATRAPELCSGVAETRVKNRKKVGQTLDSPVITMM